MKNLRVKLETLRRIAFLRLSVQPVNCKHLAFQTLLEYQRHNLCPLNDILAILRQRLQESSKVKIECGGTLSRSWFSLWCLLYNWCLLSIMVCLVLVMCSTVFGFCVSVPCSRRVLQHVQHVQEEPLVRQVLQRASTRRKVTPTSIPFKSGLF